MRYRMFGAVALGALTFMVSGAADATETETPGKKTEPLPATEPAPSEAPQSSSASDSDAADGKGAAEKEAASPAPAPAAPVAAAPAPAAPAAAAPAPAAPAAAAPAPAAPSKPLAGYKKGFYLQSADGAYKLKVGARVQTRFTFESPDGGDSEFAFSVPRARLGIKGNALTKSLGYKMQLDFGKGGAGLKDFYVDYTFSKWFRVRAGQAKMPFSRQQLNSSSKLEFVDRALTDKAFGAGRDIGVLLHNGFSKSPGFEYGLGVYNGTGAKGSFSGSGSTDLTTGSTSVDGGKFSNVPDRMHPAVALRIGYNYGKLKGYSEGDFEGGGLRFGVGANTLIHFDADEGNDGKVAAGVDVALKAHGFAATGGYYLGFAQKTEAWADQEMTAQGLHVQASYVAMDVVQPAVRYGRIFNDGPNNDKQEILVGLGYLPFGHNFKVQLDGGALLSEQAAPDGSSEVDTTLADIRTRLQLQLNL